MKFICIGRNYAAHAAELNNPVPETPLIFTKPDNAMLHDNKPLYYPDFTKDLHYEVEVLVRISRLGKHIEPQFAHKYYKELTVGIDFTARDIQNQLKEKGQPWELAKGWDGSAAVGQYIPKEEAFDKNGNIQFSLIKNGEKVQDGNTKDMLTNIDNLIAYVSKFFTLKKGDVLFTGTPKGVGPVQIGDVLKGYIGDKQLLECEIK